MFSILKTIAWIALSGMLVITAAQAQDGPPGSAATSAGQSTADRPRWQIEDTTCEQLLAAPEDDRASAALFYYGYLAGRANITSLDAQQIEVNIAKVIDYCTQNPNTTVPRAFIQALVCRVGNNQLVMLSFGWETHRNIKFWVSRTPRL